MTREKQIDWLCRLRANLNNGVFFTPWNKEFTEALNDVLEQEPKTGHWIDDKCSVCGKGTEDLISSREWYRNEEPNFCPFCGVKLEIKEDIENA